MWHWICPLLGVMVAAAFPLGWHIQTLQREQRAEETLHALGTAQLAFRGAGGAGGFATDLASLQAPCSGQPPIAAAAPSADTVTGYVMTLRAGRDSTPAGVDCHGRPTSSDYYAAVAPRPGRTDGRRAFAMTSAGRVFVFFDGIAPTETDMAAGGLATPREVLDTFKIP
jgi:type II secretory pathway pseudopilin PulG